LGVIAQGGVGRGGRERLAVSAEQTLLRMAKVAGMDLLAEGRHERIMRIEGLRHKLGGLMNDTTPIESPLMRLAEDKRRNYEHFFELIYECSTNRVAAKALVDRILMRLE
jgi:molecular chaperone HtpG